MNFLKNSHIAKLYNISRPTVGKWIIAAKNNDNLLELVEIDGVEYIIDSKHNHKEIENLKYKGGKYRNKIGYELLIPDKKIYNIFNESQVIEMITSLKTNKIIPLKFTYFDIGAEMWDNYVNEDLKNKDYSYNREQEILIKSTLDYLKLKIDSYSKINIIDIGTGNGYISRSVIDKVISLNKDIKYTGVDISSSMIEILKKNLNEWYPNLKASFEVADIDYAVLRDLLFFNKHDSENSCNLVLFFGSTIGNVYDRKRIYKNFYDSMSNNDLLWINNGLETPNEIEFIKELVKNKSIVEKFSWIPNLFGFRKEMYTLDVKYNTSISSYTVILRLNKDLDLKFMLKGRESMIRFKQGDEIIVWNSFSYKIESFANEINSVGFTIVNQACYPDNSEALLLCEVKN
jgi:uncharacterized SAM-dependent methyltransferase